MHENPPVITKFFKSEDLKYYEKGNFRIGTLQYYRKAENVLEMGARHDQNEGVEKNIISGIILPNSTSQYYRGIHIVKSSVVFDKCVSHKEADAHIFCASKGSYSKDQHKVMMFGDEHRYKGDKRLTHYAEINLEKFIDALADIIVHNLDRIKIKNGLEIKIHDVIYSDDVNKIYLTGTLPKEKGINLETLTTKATIFTPENETRILIAGPNNQLAEEPIEPFNISSDALKDSIIRIDSWAE